MGLLAFNPKLGDVYDYLFYICVFYIVFPLIVSLIQLNIQLSKWKNDVILANTDVLIWVQNKVIFLYFVAVICGSSFTAIALCNCYLLQQSTFSMGLSNYHKRKFQNKRFFSIVLFEVW